MTADPIREFVAGKIARYEKVIVHAPDRRGRLRQQVSYRKVKDGWGPAEALAWAKDRDTVETFRDCARLVRLCGDEKARAMPEHAMIHQLSGVVGCCGERMLAETAKSLGISEQRAKALVDQLEQEWSATEGLTGGV